MLAEKKWNAIQTGDKKIVLVDFSDIKPALDFAEINYNTATSVDAALKTKADLYIFSGIDNKCSINEIKQIREYVAKGGKIFISNSPETAQQIYPEYISGNMKPTEGDIANMEIPESPVFDDIDLLELRYFNNNKREIPTICNTVLKVNRNANIEELANQTKIHGYINGDMTQRSEYVKTIKGYPLLKIHDNKGVATISTMSLEKAVTDPVAGKLLTNIIYDLLK